MPVHTVTTDITTMSMPLRNALILIICLRISALSQDDIRPNRVVPSTKQIAYQEMEFVGFIHFNMNTFTGKEWGYGDEDPRLFNPARLDVEQWVRTAEAAGMKELILTAKHHDGFCLWPSAFTEHSIKNSPYKGGKGDIVREFTDACRRHGIKAGLYLSPWDRNNKAYGTRDYIVYYENQLRELLTNYGKISEVWFDGANGGDGYYGGAREKRTIDPASYYPWKEFQRIVYELQPQALIFSDAGPDLRWIGNEVGQAGETCWSTINTDSIVIGKSNPKYLNTGDPDGRKWVVGVCDVSIRPGWFFHAREDSLVKSVRKLLDLYYTSVGRNAVLLLNVPPDRHGLLNDRDVDTLKKFRAVLDETFRTNLTLNGSASASSSLPMHLPGNVIDNDNGTYWAAEPDQRKAAIELELKGTEEFNRIVLQEPIQFGQRISAFEIQVPKNHSWETVAKGTTIGYKRILRIPTVCVGALRLLIEDAISSPAISSIGLYKASPLE
jgi:alpha-L-fucosidase